MTETEQYKDGIGVTTLKADAKEQFPEKSPWKINGVAIPENTILNGGQGVDHFFPPEKAREAAEVMDKQIKNGDTVHLVSGFHELEGQADPNQIVGEITAAGYEKGVGVVFEGETISEDVADRIAHGYVDVSPTVARSLGEFSEEMGGQEVERVSGFRDVAIVANGQNGVDVSVGGNPAVEALSMDALSRGWDTLETDMTPPEQAQTNAQAVLDIRDKTDAMTETGWERANQLADGESLSTDVIQKMAQFNRHRDNAEYGNFSDIPESKKSEDAENPWWEDNGTVAWLGWGGTAGVEWAIERSDEMDTNENDTLQDTKSVAGVSFQGTKEGKLDESEIDENFGDHALYGEGENKEDYSYWVVDADGFLRKGNVESAHSLGCRGQCPSDETHDEKLMQLAQEFENPPEFAQEDDSMEAIPVVKEVPVEENSNEVTVIEK